MGSDALCARLLIHSAIAGSLLLIGHSLGRPSERSKATVWTSAWQTLGAICSGGGNARSSSRGMAFQNLSERAQGRHVLRASEFVAVVELAGRPAPVHAFARAPRQ